MRKFLYSPDACCFMSDWVYPFPLADPRISRRDLRSWRASARRERPALLRLENSGLTPDLERLQKGVHAGHELVRVRAMEYASPVYEQLRAAQATLEEAQPASVPHPVGELPSCGVERQLYADDLRRAYASSQMVQQHRDAVARAKVAQDIAAKNLALIGELATRAFELWDQFGAQLFDMHYTFAFCSQPMPPNLARAIYSSLEPGETWRPILEPPPLDARPKQISPGAGPRHNHQSEEKSL